MFCFNLHMYPNTYEWKYSYNAMFNVLHILFIEINTDF